MRFDFTTSNRIVFGTGALTEVGKYAKPLGTRALVVTGRDASRAQTLLDLLREAGIEATTFSVEHEPDVQTIETGVKLARAQDRDLLVGFGGGAAIDAAKAIAGLLTNSGEIFDYLEVIGKGLPLQHAAVPMVAIPTTAGTGAEVTSNAVVFSAAHQVKVSLRHPLMLPKVALVDPALTYSAPPAVTAASGLDALTQVIEAYTSNKANPLTDSLCREGISRAGRSLQTVYEQPTHAAAREDMAITSLFSGIALSNAKLGAVHGFAGPMGGMFYAAHGALCAALLPAVMQANVSALTASQPMSPLLLRYREIATLLLNDPTASIDQGIEFVAQLQAQLQIKPLRDLGVTEADFPAIIEKAKVSSSMQGNPVALTVDDLTQILSKAL